MTRSQKMGIPERKEREKERKRSLMIKAAEELIQEKGLSNLNMDEVALRAEVSKGSLYQYFNTKTNLILGICDKASSLFNEEVAKVLGKDLPGLQLVYLIGETFLTFVTEHPEYFRAMRFLDTLKDVNKADEDSYFSSCIAHRQSTFTCTVRAIQIGMQDGSINSTYDAKELAVLIWSTSHGLVSLIYQDQNNGNHDLLSHLDLDVHSLLKGYFKLIGCGIATEKNKNIYD